ncbi:expressed unknown protein [Seminavis robusta]|uniref:Uncharacterized protein n=1 Tax=Seminavis robusta TaxID=568900 RepID=A0A9N8HFP5_9STRA|nr:expressed unknown protein [Seminavis robusta]|eukprot:Sro358_g125890.1 n/a (219) ;mRNA; f:37365-38138
MTSFRSTLLLLVATIAASSAFVVPSAGRANTKLAESFGFDFAEDTYENQPDFLKGEGEYKTWVGQTTDNSFINRQYNVIRRVREMNLLKTTADAGILSKLEGQGLDLVTIEKLLPVIEDTGALSIAGNNQQLLVNLVAPLLVEPAPLLLPVVAGAVETGPSAFYLASAVCLGLDAALFATGAELPFVGLSAGVFLGLLLVPLAGASGVAGYALGSLKK